jgi:hypothetical protein
MMIAPSERNVAPAMMVTDCVAPVFATPLQRSAAPAIKTIKPKTSPSPRMFFPYPTDWVSQDGYSRLFLRLAKNSTSGLRIRKPGLL